MFEGRTSGSFWDTGVKGLEKTGLFSGSSGVGLRKVGFGGFGGEDFELAVNTGGGVASDGVVDSLSERARRP